MQLALALTADLDQANDRDTAALNSLLQTLLNEVGIGTKQLNKVLFKLTTLLRFIIGVSLILYKEIFV